MLKPFYMLNGQIDLVKETKPFKLNEKDYVEKTYVDEGGDSAVVAVPVKPKLLTKELDGGGIFTGGAYIHYYADEIPQLKKAFPKEFAED